MAWQPAGFPALGGGRWASGCLCWVQAVVAGEHGGSPKILVFLVCWTGAALVMSPLRLQNWMGRPASPSSCSFRDTGIPSAFLFH